MLRKEWNSNALGIIFPIFVAAFSGAWAYMVIGPAILDSTNLKWVYGDLAQMYIAWGQYLADTNAHWLTTTRLSYPLPMSVSLFDPMPLFLLLARPFAGLFGEGRQFIGAYYIACLVLQGGLGYYTILQGLKLLGIERKGLTRYIAGIGGILLASMPYTFYRFQADPAMSSQWVLLLSIWATLATLEANLQRWLSVNGFVLFVATGINLYLALMVLVSNIVIVLFRWKIYGLKGLILRISVIFLVAAASASIFEYLDAAGAPTGGYGYYSMNMLGPFDSNGAAGLFRINVPDATGGQTFEGYTYLGLGGNLIWILALLSFIPFRTQDNKFPFVPAIMVVVCCYLLALSSTVTFSNHALHVPLPHVLHALVSRFRASARIFWMAGFWMMVVAVVALAHRFGLRWASILLTVFLIVQFFDIRPATLKIRKSLESFKAYELKGIDTKDAQAVLVYPPWQCDSKETPGGIRNYESVGYFALHHQLPTNNIYAARTPKKQTAFHCDYERRLQELDPDAIYLLSQELYSQHEAAFSGRFSCTERTSAAQSKKPFWVCTPSPAALDSSGRR